MRFSVVAAGDSDARKRIQGPIEVEFATTVGNLLDGHSELVQHGDQERRRRLMHVPEVAPALELVA